MRPSSPTVTARSATMLSGVKACLNVSLRMAPQCKAYMHDLLVHNARIHPLTDGLVASDATTLAVDDGRISALGVPADVQARVRVDAGGRVLLPGFVDCH